jgi:DNA polymerase III psi subunit
MNGEKVARMTRLSQGQAIRLKAIGIERWVSRQMPEVDAQPRVRLSAGRGSWLLVQRHPWRGQFGTLLADITASLGVENCRFGQWANTEEAGVSITEMGAQGVSYVLSFGPPPRGATHERLIEVATMQALNEDPHAKSELWQALSKVLY